VINAQGVNSFSKSLLIGACGFLFAAGAARGADFAFGADLSFLKQAEDRGKVFQDGTNAMPGLQIFREHGYNWIRLRIFVEPVGENLPNDLKYTLAMAQAARKLGYKFLLDFHYASTWADPGKQPTPKQWEAMSPAERANAVFAYTRDTIAALREGGALPDMVQIGNEVSDGMLWPDGQLPDHWDHFAAYLYAGINGVDAGRGNGPRPQIMIHVDFGGQKQKTKWFFDKLNSYDIPYDVIGFSYYPRWQGSLMDVRENLAFTAHEYGKDIIVVETGYNWKPIPETSDRPQPFPITPEGQRDFLDELTRIVMDVPGGRGKGVFWWEPAALHNIGMRSLFDDDGKSLPALTVFDKYTRPSLKKN
jgi:arabinogalactan endo-1,4-beta-galactosidase